MADMDTGIRESGKRPGRGSGVHWGLALLLMSGVALAARLYRLDEQGVWYDEFASIQGILNGGDFSTFLAMTRVLNPESTPLYFVLQYLWAQAFGTTMLAMRLLPVIAGVLCVPVVYRLGTLLHSRWAGLLACAFVALSPAHIWHAQGLRPYALLLLLAACSLVATLEVRGGRKRWWLALVITDGLMLATHLFGALIVLCQFLYLLAYERRRKRHLLGWTAANAGFVAIAAWWIYPSHVFIPGADEDHYVLPGLTDIAFDLFGDDLFHRVHEFPPQPETWGFLPASFRAWVLENAEGADVLLLLGAVLAVLWCTRRMWNPPGGPEDRRKAAFCLVVFLVPVVLLAAASHAWRPCMEHRYSQAGSLALYVMMAGMTLSLNRRWLRNAALSAWAVLYTYQLSLVLPADMRPGWAQVAEHLEEHASAEDAVISWPMFSRTLLRLHWPGAQDLSQHTCAPTLAELRRQLRTRLTDRPTRTVWLVLGMESAARLETLRAWFDETLYPLELTWDRFPGLGSVLVAAVRPQPHAAARWCAHRLPIDEMPDYQEYVATARYFFGEDYTEEEVRLASRLPAHQTPKPWRFVIPLWAWELGHTELARSLALKELERYENSPRLYLVLALAEAYRGNRGGAMEAYERARRLDDIVAPLFEDFFRDWWDPERRQQALASLRKLRGFVYLGRIAYAKLSEAARMESRTDPSPAEAPQSP